MTYCTEADARSAGARGSHAEIAAAITAAQERVDLYTGDTFQTVPLTVTAEVDQDGYAYLHRRIATITSVTWAGATAPIDPLGYRVSSSSVPGGRDRIELYGALGWADVTVLGAEPWNGGWVGFASRYGPPTVTVVGTFGWSSVPLQVRDATAALTAHLLGVDADRDDPTIYTDEEGNVLPVVTSPQQPALPTPEHTYQGEQRTNRTTGSRVVDELLEAYVRTPVRIS